MQTLSPGISRATRSQCGKFVLAAAILASSHSFLHAQQTELQAEKVLQSRSETKNVVSGKILKMEGSVADLLVDDQSTPFIYDDFTIFEIDGQPGSYKDIPVGADVKFFPDTSKDGRIYKMSYRSQRPGRIMTNNVDGQAEVALPVGNSKAQGKSSAGRPPVSSQKATGDIEVETNPVKPADIGVVLKTTTEGVLVKKVEKDKAAHKAGLQPGDIIIKVGETNLATGEGVHREINQYKVSSAVPITIEREGERKQLSLTRLDSRQASMNVTARKPAQSQTSQPDQKSANPGWTLTEINNRILISEVAANSLIAKSEAREGDQLLQVNGVKVTSEADVQAAMNRSRPGEPVKLTVKRGATTMFLTLNNLENDTSDSTQQNTNSSILEMLKRQQQQISELQHEMRSLKAELRSQQ